MGMKWRFVFPRFVGVFSEIGLFNQLIEILLREIEHGCKYRTEERMIEKSEHIPFQEAEFRQRHRLREFFRNLRAGRSSL